MNHTIKKIREDIYSTEKIIESMESEQVSLDINTITRYISDLANIKYLKGYVEGMKVVLKEMEYK